MAWPKGKPNPNKGVRRKPVTGIEPLNPKPEMPEPIQTLEQQIIEPSEPIVVAPAPSPAEAFKEAPTYTRAQEAAELQAHLNQAPAVAEAPPTDLLARLERLEATVKEKPIVSVAAPKKSSSEDQLNQKVRDIQVRRAQMAEGAYASDALDPCSSSMTLLLRDNTAYRNLDGSDPIPEGYQGVWISLRNESEKETASNVQRALLNGGKHARDLDGGMITGMDSVYMALPIDRMALMIAAGLEGRSGAGKKDALAHDKAEQSRTRKRGLVSENMHQMDDREDLFAPGSVLI